MAAGGFSLKVDVGPVLSDWKAVVNRGLIKSGQQFQAEIRRYPPQHPGSSYRRTRDLGNRAQYRVAASGNRMEVGSTFYGPFVIFGTGLYGPKHRMIKPKTKKVLAWKGSGGEWIFAKETKGSIWPGKLNAIKVKMDAGLREGVREGVAGKL